MNISIMNIVVVSDRLNEHTNIPFDKNNYYWVIANPASRNRNTLVDKSNFSLDYSMITQPDHKTSVSIGSI